MAGVRRKIAEQMSLAKQTIPHYSYIDECDVTALVQLRDSLKASLTNRGVRLTYLPFFLKAAAAALVEIPIVNSSLDDKAGEIVLHADYHLGIAVATDAGLIVPVVRQVDRLDIVAIAREVERLSEAARNGRIKREELQGATFAVTSIGNVGGLMATPIINPPQTAIMGVGRIVKRPVYDAAGQLRPADMVYLSFSFDHRVIDGAIGAAFGNAVKRRLENPAELMLPAP
jgi:pyruvate dehydrogenase E2 component (dihydrolipoamide acetyltransferase)/2-oxoisovalerate dehydrogenase E2 component (dihydrolipoyl transacylase)